MRLFDFTGMFGLMFETPGDGAGGGGEQAAGAGAPNSDGAKPGADGQAGKAGTGGSNSPGAAGSTAKFEDDPRFKGVLSDLAKERKARQKFEADYRASQAAVEQERRRVQALAGVNPRSPEQEQDEAVRARFQQLFPGLAKLTDEQINRLMQVAENADNLDATTNQMWQRHGRQMLDSVIQRASKSMGGELTERQRIRLERAYFNEAASNEQFLARHEAGDPKLVEEFVKEFVEDFVEPGRRNALASEQERMRRVPSSRDRSIVGANGKAPDLSKPSEFEDAAVAAFRKHGGGFGARD